MSFFTSMLVTALVVDVDTLVALVQVQTKFIIGVVVARNITTTGDDLVAVASVVHELRTIKRDVIKLKSHLFRPGLTGEGV